MRSSAYPEAVAVSTSSSIPEGTVVGVATNMEIPSAPSLMSSSQTSLRYLNINHRNSSFYNSHVASTINMGATKRFLTSKGWSEGLQDFLIHNVATKLPYRFFICDDSGSMVTSDGKRLYNNTSGNNRGTPPKIVKCSRWAELVDALRFHVSLAEAMNLHSEFRLLNGSAQPVIVGGPESTPESSVVMNSLLDGSPCKLFIYFYVFFAIASCLLTMYFRRQLYY